MCANTIDKYISILKAYNEGKSIEIKRRDDDNWCELVYPNFDFTHNEYRIQPERPTLSKSWEDFYERNKGNIEFYYKFPTLVRNDKYSIKMRTFAKLLLLRDEYRQGWIPDWSDNNRVKFAITYDDNKIDKCYTYTSQMVLTFQSEDICDLFYENFKEMIEDVKDLI